MTIHHRANEAKFVLTEVEHAEDWVFGKHRHNHNVASLLNGFHQRTHTGLHASHLETNLIALIAEHLLGSVFQRFVQHIGSIFYTTLPCLGKTQVAHVGNEHLLGTTRLAELCHKVADGTGSTHYHVLVLHVRAVSGMGAHCRRLYHCAIVEAHSCGQYHYTVVGGHKIVLRNSIGLKRLNAQMFAYIILSAFAWSAFSAHQLRASRDVIARSAYRHILTDSHYHCRILMSLHYRIERCRMQAMIGMNLTATDSNTLYVYQHLVSLQVLCLGCLNILKLDVPWGN